MPMTPESVDAKYGEYITGLNLQISALSMMYALLLARVTALENPGSLPDLLPPAMEVPPTPNTAARNKAANTPPHPAWPNLDPDKETPDAPPG